MKEFLTSFYSSSLPFSFLFPFLWRNGIMRFCSYVSITHHSIPSNVLDNLHYIILHCQSVFSFDDVTKHSTSLSIDLDEISQVLSSLYSY